ncbi:MAG TPA: mannosyltransferase family protein [Anaerolineales bacterium]|jgi:hypothetical protein
MSSAPPAGPSRSWLRRIGERWVARLAGDDWTASLVWGLTLTLGLRLGLGVLMAAVWWVAGPHLDPTLLATPELHGGIPIPDDRLGQALLGVWLRWDAVHHMRLAQFGYLGAEVGSSTFYPLYAGLVALVRPLLGGATLVTGLLVSTLAALAAFTLLHRLVSERVSSGTARWTLLALAVFPTSFFLIAPYTESLFLALTLGALLAAHRQRWLLAGLLAGLSALTRGPGIVNALPLAWIAWHRWRQAPAGSRRPLALAPGLVAAAMPLLAAAGFQWWRSQLGFPPLTVTLGQHARQTWVGPLRGPLLAVGQLLDLREYLPLIEVLAAVGFTVLLLALLRNPALPRPSWGLYLAGNLFVLLGLHSMQASYWRSMARYVLILFPAFAVIGHWLASARPWVRLAYLALSSSWLLAHSALSAVYIFVG